MISRGDQILDMSTTPSCSRRTWWSDKLASDGPAPGASRSRCLLDMALRHMQGCAVRGWRNEDMTRGV